MIVMVGVNESFIVELIIIFNTYIKKSYLPSTP